MANTRRYSDPEIDAFRRDIRHFAPAGEAGRMATALPSRREKFPGVKIEGTPTAY